MGLLLNGCQTDDTTAVVDGAVAGSSLGDRAASLHPAEGDETALFLGVWGAAANDIWFAGGVRGGDGVLGHFDGQRLARVAIPPGPALWWTWGADARHLWAVGEGGRVLGWGDRRWQAEDSGLSELAVLWGVWGSSATDLWAVGGSMRPGGPKGLLIRSNGDGHWTTVRDAALPTESNLFKVWGSGANDVHMVGEGGVALHFDGTMYQQIETGTTDRLLTVHGQPDGPVLAVGGDTAAVALRFEDGRWVDDQPPEGLPPLNGVFVADNGWAVITAARGVILSRSPEGEWTRHAEPARAYDLQRDTLHAVWVGADLWAVGGDLDRGIGRVLTDREPAPPIDGTPALWPDAGLPDAALPDAAPLDATLRDAALLDAALPDAALPDAALPDAQWPDAEPDAAIIDAEVDAAPGCGDGTLDETETCDDGNTTGGDGCDSQCLIECGNGRLDPGERCDDGATVAGDGCDPLCQLECGNGAVEAFEQCDDGNREAGDGCNPNCLLECGNHQLDLNETCDDGNRAAGDGCDATCRAECGNGQLDGQETCDDTNTDPGDGCDARCQLECGNRVLDPGEACDDGNRRDGDGCDAACAIEPLPGPGDACPDFVCSEQLECWGIADAGFINICTAACDSVDDCFADFGDNVCCQRPGPQLLDTYCVPAPLLPDGCN
jgi:cysteine-rich repeat protein